jgi:hypothetical protein
LRQLFLGFLLVVLQEEEGAFNIVRNGNFESFVVNDHAVVMEVRSIFCPI